MNQRKFPLKIVEAYISSDVNKPFADFHLIPADEYLLLFFYRVLETRMIVLNELTLPVYG